MIVQQIQKRMLVSLAQIAKEAGVNEGDYIIIEHENGKIVLTPVGWHEKSQEYIWSKEWQEKLRQSEEDIEQGRYKKFQNIDDLIADLEDLEKNGGTDKN